MTLRVVMTRTLAAGAAAAFMVLAAPIHALAQSYPSRPVRVIVPFPGGNVTDTWVRAIMERAQTALGQPIIVEPKPGAGAMIGAQYALAQPADGYTMLMYTSSHAIRSAGPNPPFDVRKDLVPVVRNFGGAFFLAVNAEKVPAKTLAEFISYARANPGKLNFSSYGPNTLGHLGSLLFAKEANIQVVHVPYNGSSANVLALASGDSHVAFDVLQALTPHVQSGKVRILAVGNAERFELAPQYPGMKESGFGLEITAINGTTAKAGTPREAIVKFNAAVNAAIREPKLVEYFSKVGQKLYGGTPEELGRLINAEYKTFDQVIREYNIKFD